MPRDLPAGATAFDDIRSLPIAVRPVDGETSESHFTRLATANSLTPEALWSHLRALHKQLPFKRDAQLATTELEALGGLRESWFVENRYRHLLPLRCHHTKWKFSTCLICCRVPAAQSGCLRCGHGERTQVTTRTGPICLRHQRWHYQDIDLDVSGLPAYLAAERRLRHDLGSRGISLETGELQLACILLKDWNMPVGRDRLISGRAVEGKEGDDPDHIRNGFASVFPEAVELTCVLTDPEFTNLLLSPRWSPSQHAHLLSSVVTPITRRPLSDATIDTLWETVKSGSRAVEAAYAMSGQRRQSKKCSLQRAFCAAAYTHRACLLRHLDAKDMPSTLNTRYGRSSPPARSLIKYQQA